MEGESVDRFLHPHLNSAQVLSKLQCWLAPSFPRPGRSHKKPFDKWSVLGLKYSRSTAQTESFLLGRLEVTARVLSSTETPPRRSLVIFGLRGKFPATKKWLLLDATVCVLKVPRIKKVLGLLYLHSPRAFFRILRGFAFWLWRSVHSASYFQLWGFC